MKAKITAVYVIINPNKWNCRLKPCSHSTSWQVVRLSKEECKVSQKFQLSGVQIDLNTHGRMGKSTAKHISKLFILQSHEKSKANQFSQQQVGLLALRVGHLIEDCLIYVDIDLMVQKEEV